MLHVRKMALVDPRLLKSLRENPTPLPDAIDTALRDLDAEMTSILAGSDADESEKVRLYNQALLRYNDMTKARAAKPIPVVVEVKKEAAATTMPTTASVTAKSKNTRSRRMAAVRQPNARRQHTHGTGRQRHKETILAEETR